MIEIWKITGNAHKRKFEMVRKLSSKSIEKVHQLSFSFELKRFKQPPLASFHLNSQVIIWDISSSTAIFQFELDFGNLLGNSIVFKFIAQPNSKYLQLLVSKSNGSLHTVQIPDSATHNTDFQVYFKKFDFGGKHDNSDSGAKNVTAMLASLEPSNSYLNTQKLQKGSTTSSKLHTNLPFAVLFKCLFGQQYELIYLNLSEKQILQEISYIASETNSISVSNVKCNALLVSGAVPVYLFPTINEKNLKVEKIQKFLISSKHFCYQICWHPFEEDTFAAAIFKKDIQVFDLKKGFLKSFYPMHQFLRIFRLSWGPDVTSSNPASEYALYLVQKTDRVGKTLNLYMHSLRNNKTYRFDELLSPNTLEVLRNYTHCEDEITDYVWRDDFKWITIFSSNAKVLIFKREVSSFSLVFAINCKQEAVWCASWSPFLSLNQNSLKFCYAQTVNGITVVDLTEQFAVQQQTSSKLPLQTFDLKAILQGHTDHIVNLEWCPHNPDLLASSSFDCSVIIWNVTTGAPCVHFAEHLHKVCCVTWYPTEDCPDMLISGDKWGPLYAWRMGKQPKGLPKKRTNLLSEEQVIQLNFTIDTALDDQVDRATVEEESSNAETVEASKVHGMLEKDSLILTKKSNAKKKQRTSLMNCLNRFENSVNQAQQYDDLRSILDQTDRSKFSNDRLLLYGDEEHARRLIELERKNHLAHDDVHSANLVTLLGRDIRQTVIKASNEKRLTDHLVAMSIQVSTVFWKHTAIRYSDQLAENGEIVLAAEYLMSVMQQRKAIELLVRHGYVHEALVSMKCICPSDSTESKAMTVSLAEHCVQQGQVDTAVKLYASIQMFYEAAALLSRRFFDSTAMSLCVHLCKKGLASQ
jgi:WD40 repeat protein